MIKESVYDAFYKLTDNRSQIRSYVFDVVRATVPNMFLDDVRFISVPFPCIAVYNGRETCFYPDSHSILRIASAVIRMLIHAIVTHMLDRLRLTQTQRNSESFARAAC